MKMPGTIKWEAAGKILGNGGQATVRLVKQRGDGSGTLYALKELRNTGSTKARERFRREIEAIKQLNSPRIAKIIDSSEPGDKYQFYVMDYYEGAQTLEEIIYGAHNPFYSNPLKCLSLFEQIGLAIRDCENNKPQIVHRDIKPGNILILPDQSIRLIDFGICQIDDGQIITFSDENVGSRNYTAPECEAGIEGEIGVWSDFYSAAKVIWSAITSQRAFARELPVYGKQSLRLMLPENMYSWHLVSIFEKTIRNDPNQRFKNTEALLQCLNDVKDLIRRGFPPLEMVGKNCPACGNHTVTHYDRGVQLFANPEPNGISYMICNTCGYIFVRSHDILSSNYARLINLD